MTSVDRIRVPWTGGRGGPGVSTFYCLEGSAGLAAVQNFFDTNKALIPLPITWTFLGTGDTLVAETGVLSGAWAGSGQPTVVATGSNANMADAVGCVVNWVTDSILFGHRVKGRTFLVPGIKDMYVDGTLSDGVKDGIQAAAETMIDEVPGNFVVWTRPFAGTPEWTDKHGRVHPARAAHAGALSPIIGATVPDFGAVLRSRRD